jgi:hypothetical protein
MLGFWGMGDPSVWRGFLDDFDVKIALILRVIKRNPNLIERFLDFKNSNIIA